MPISDLPDEIMTMIFRYFDLDFDHHKRRVYLRTLYSLALVSRRWCSNATPWLYHRISSAEAHIELLIATFQKVPRLAIFLKKLKIAENYRDSSVFNRLTGSISSSSVQVQTRCSILALLLDQANALQYLEVDVKLFYTHRPEYSYLIEPVIPDSLAQSLTAHKQGLQHMKRVALKGFPWESDLAYEMMLLSRYAPEELTLSELRLPKNWDTDVVSTSFNLDIAARTSLKVLNIHYERMNRWGQGNNHRHVVHVVKDLKILRTLRVFLGDHERADYSFKSSLISSLAHHCSQLEELWVQQQTIEILWTDQPPELHGFTDRPKIFTQRNTTSLSKFGKLRKLHIDIDALVDWFEVENIEWPNAETGYLYRAKRLKEPSTVLPFSLEELTICNPDDRVCRFLQALARTDPMPLPQLRHVLILHYDGLRWPKHPVTKRSLKREISKAYRELQECRFTLVQKTVHMNNVGEPFAWRYDDLHLR